MIQRRHDQVPVHLRVRIDAALLTPLRVLLGWFDAMLVAVQPCHRGADLYELIVLEGDAHVAGHGGDRQRRVAVEHHPHQLVLDTLGELGFFGRPLRVEHVHASDEAAEVRELLVLECGLVGLTLPLLVVLRKLFVWRGAAAVVVRRGRLEWVVMMEGWEHSWWACFIQTGMGIHLKKEGDDCG
jgi:hypothetical protein